MNRSREKNGPSEDGASAKAPGQGLSMQRPWGGRCELAKAPGPGTRAEASGRGGGVALQRPKNSVEFSMLEHEGLRGWSRGRSTGPARLWDSG